MSLRVLAIAAALTFAACGPSGSSDDTGDDQPPGRALRIEPGDVTLLVENHTAATQVYRVIETDDRGDDHDVTADAALSLGLPLGSFDGATFTSAPDRGGRTTVTATWEDLTATADLTVLLRSVIVEPGVPSDVPGDFATAGTGGAAPRLVYPASGVIVPPTLNSFEFHFEPGAGNDAFELTFTGSAIQLVVYLTCAQPVGAGCIWEPSQSTWDTLATAARGDAPLTYKLRGLDHDAGAPVAGVSDEQWMQVSSDDLAGGIYYWAAGAGAVMRYDFGRRGASAERFLGVGQTSASTCVGCHALSRDGSQIAVGLDIPGPAALETYTVATRTRQFTTATSGFPGFPSPNGANFFSFSPDNQRIVSSGGTTLVVRNAADGTGMTTAVQNATMPDWSPDGSAVVFARPGQAAPAANPGVSRGSIVRVDASTWTGEQTLVASAGENNYYPSFSPDNQWVVFNRAAGTDSFDAPDAKVYVVSAGGGTPIALQAATSTNGDSWPKWGPLVHHYAEGTLLWVTFSSRRPYGLRGGTNSQIWMVGLDPARAAQGLDPSFAAFWLPFQDFASGNHIAQWVENVDRQECPDGSCPAGELCEGGLCVPVIE